MLLYYQGGAVMVQRKILKHITDFYNSQPKKALLITGARQVGKTFLLSDLYANVCTKQHHAE